MTTQTKLPPAPFFERWIRASKTDMLMHAQALETQMRLLAALLESRDAIQEGGPTPTSTQAIAEAKRLAEMQP